MLISKNVIPNQQRRKKIEDEKKSRFCFGSCTIAYFIFWRIGFFSVPVPAIEAKFREMK